MKWTFSRHVHKLLDCGRTIKQKLDDILRTLCAVKKTKTKKRHESGRWVNYRLRREKRTAGQWDKKCFSGKNKQTHNRLWWKV